jgi:hypothetical protein
VLHTQRKTKKSEDHKIWNYWIKKNEMKTACDTEKENAHRGLPEKPVDKRPVGGTRRRWEDCIVMDFNP